MLAVEPVPAPTFPPDTGVLKKRSPARFVFQMNTPVAESNQPLTPANPAPAPVPNPASSTASKPGATRAKTLAPPLTAVVLAVMTVLPECDTVRSSVEVRVDAVVMPSSKWQLPSVVVFVTQQLKKPMVPEPARPPPPPEEEIVSVVPPEGVSVIFAPAARVQKEGTAEDPLKFPKIELFDWELRVPVSVPVVVTGEPLTVKRLPVRDRPTLLTPVPPPDPQGKPVLLTTPAVASRHPPSEGSSVVVPVTVNPPVTERIWSMANVVAVWLKCEVFAPTLTLVDISPIAVLNVVAFPDPSPRNVVMPDELNLFPKLDETPSLPFI